MSAGELRELIDDIMARAQPDEDLWHRLQELGLTLVGVPESANGSGGTLRDLADIAEALAAHGVALPLIEHATSAWALAASGQQPVSAATIALIADINTHTAPAVPWAENATHLVVASVGGDAVGIVDLTASATIEKTVDFAGIPLSRVHWTGEPELLPKLGGTAMISRLALLRAATALGAAQSAYRLTHGHVGTREQFGRPLIALPAVRNGLARMRVQLIQLDSAISAARENIDKPTQLAKAVAARVLAASVATEIAQLAHQLHGAIGVTHEYTLHPLTTTLWAARDADLPEDNWARLLGDLVIDGGDPTLWEMTGTA